MNGEVKHAPVSPLAGGEGKARDLTEELNSLRQECAHLRAQLALTDCQGVLAAAIENISEAIVVYDRDGRLVACNRNFRELYGYTVDEVRPGVHFAALGRIDIERGNVAVGDEYGGGDAYLARKAEYRKRLEGSFTVRLKDGRWIRTNDRPMADGGFVSVQSDITEIKKNEHALNLAKEAAETSAQLKSEFLASVSHDLRTPLNAIVGFSEMVQTEVFGEIGNAKYKDYIEIINNSGQQLLTIVDAVLDMAKLESGAVSFDDERFDPLAFSKDLLRGFDHIAQKKNLSITASASDDVPSSILAEKRTTMQILNNLVANASRHVDDGGRIAVDWSVQDGDSLILSVSDNGCGMPAEVVARVGEPFLSGNAYVAQRPGRGAGLGLYICCKLAAARGGVLAIDSEPDIGTTVSVRWTLDSLYPLYEKAGVR